MSSPAPSSAKFSGCQDGQTKLLERLESLESKVTSLESELRLVKRKLHNFEQGTKSTINRCVKDRLKRQQFVMTLCPTSDEIQINDIMPASVWGQEQEELGHSQDFDEDLDPISAETDYGEQDENLVESDPDWGNATTKTNTKRKRQAPGVGPKSRTSKSPAVPAAKKRTRGIKSEVIETTGSGSDEEDQEEQGIIKIVKIKSLSSKKPPTSRSGSTSNSGTGTPKDRVQEMREEFQVLLREKVEENPKLNSGDILKKLLASLPPHIHPTEFVKPESIKRKIRKLRNEYL